MDTFACLPTAQLVEERYVAPHPVTARQRISEWWSCKLDIAGLECEGIATIRDLVESQDRDLRYARALLITAPHTHWGDAMIVETFDDSRNVFINGPTTAPRRLHPFSFVFSSEGALPYEWADESVPFAEGELSEIYNFIAELNALVVSRFEDDLPIPLGITIDHRFKRSMWNEQLFSFAEGPHNEENGRAIVKHVLESVINPGSRYPNQVQVAWSAFPTSRVIEPMLNRAESRALTVLERRLRDMDPYVALDFVSNLESELRSSARGCARKKS